MRSGFIEGNMTHDGSTMNSGNADSRTARKRAVDPAVKAWLSNVLVPAMVQQYTLRENGGVSATGERVQ